LHFKLSFLIRYLGRDCQRAKLINHYRWTMASGSCWEELQSAEDKKSKLKYSALMDTLLATGGRLANNHATQIVHIVLFNTVFAYRAKWYSVARFPRVDFKPKSVPRYKVTARISHKMVVYLLFELRGPTLKPSQRKRYLVLKLFQFHGIILKILNFTICKLKIHI
jgi:hypothetical protein